MYDVNDNAAWVSWEKSTDTLDNATQGVESVLCGPSATLISAEVGNEERQ